mgnify:CR=1 FL=1
MHGRTLILAATVAVAVVGSGAVAALASASATSPRECRAGFTSQEVRLYGQRFESNPTGAPVLVQNDWTGGTDHRYVVTVACVRAMNARELNEAFYLNSGLPIPAR